MKGVALNTNQVKVLSLSPNGNGGVKIYASLNLTTEEKIELLEMALSHIRKAN
jgi:transcriptional regulator